MSSPSRAAVAHHEAGHVVAATATFGNPGLVTIVAVGDRLGHARLEAAVQQQPAWIARAVQGPLAASARATAHACVRWCLAGHVAEGLHTGARWRWHDDDDIRNALEYVAVAYPDDRTLDAWIVDRERQRVRRWLRAHWTHVTTLARALQRRGTLDGDQVRELLARVGPLRPPQYAEEREAAREMQASVRA